MPIQTFSGKVTDFKVPIFCRLMRELSKGNDELILVIYHDKLAFKSKDSKSLNILVTLSRNFFDSFQIKSPKMYSIFSGSIRNVFSMNLNSLQIIIEESHEFFGRENLMIFEVCRRNRSIQSKYSIICNKISDDIYEIKEVLEPLNIDPSLEENHWSIDPKTLKENYWPQNFKDQTVEFSFNTDGLGVFSVKKASVNNIFESRYHIPRVGFENYDIAKPTSIKFNGKCFDKFMHLAYSLKCELNAHFSDIYSKDVYLPLSFYLCGEVKEGIKIEGVIFCDHVKYENQERQNPTLTAVNTSTNTNRDGEVEYQVAEIFRRAENKKISNPYNETIRASGNTNMGNSSNNRNINFQGDNKNSNGGPKYQIEKIFQSESKAFSNSYAQANENYRPITRFNDDVNIISPIGNRGSSNSQGDNKNSNSGPKHQIEKIFRSESKAFSNSYAQANENYRPITRSNDEVDIRSPIGNRGSPNSQCDNKNDNNRPNAKIFCQPENKKFSNPYTRINVANGNTNMRNSSNNTGNRGSIHFQSDSKNSNSEPEYTIEKMFCQPENKEFAYNANTRNPDNMESYMSAACSNSATLVNDFANKRSRKSRDDNKNNDIGDYMPVICLSCAKLVNNRNPNTDNGGFSNSISRRSKTGKYNGGIKRSFSEADLDNTSMW